VEHFFTTDMAMARVFMGAVRFIAAPSIKKLLFLKVEILDF
jgi:hypothetical protein